MCVFLPLICIHIYIYIYIYIGVTLHRRYPAAGHYGPPVRAGAKGVFHCAQPPLRSLCHGGGPPQVGRPPLGPRTVSSGPTPTHPCAAAGRWRYERISGESGLRRDAASHSLHTRSKKGAENFSHEGPAIPGDATNSPARRCSAHCLFPPPPTGAGDWPPQPSRGRAKRTARIVDGT